MGFVNPVVVGANQGANHQHRCTGRSHDARQQGANAQQADIERRTAVQVAANEDAAGDRVERRQQNDERNIFSQQCVNQAGAGQRQAEQRCERNKK